jgi:hypothetical protein
MSNLIEEFYNIEGKNYNISLEECKLICNSPFKFVKEIFSRGMLKNIRLQYFGVFEVSSSRVKYSSKTLEESYTKGLISEKRYKERKEILDKYES